MGFFSTIASAGKKTGSKIKDKKNKITNNIKIIVGTEGIKNNFNIIKDGYVDMLESSSSSIKIKTKKKDFEDVIAEHGISNIQLEQMYKNYVLSCYLFQLGVVICFFLIVKSFFMSGIVFFFEFIPSLAIMILLIVLSLRCSMLCYQIKNRNLVRFVEFLRTYSYFPPFTLK